MSPSRRPKSIKVHVPRHNTQRIGPALTAEVEATAREQGIRTDIRQPPNEATSTLALAIENASDWNSLLSTARAERGPQWDVGTQQFQVDAGSELYYDPSPLLEYQKDGQEEASNSNQVDAMSGGPTTPLPPQRQQQNMGNQYPMNGIGVSPGMHPSSRLGMSGQMGGNYPGQFGAVPPNQFYGNDRQSPMVTRGMSMDNMGITPDVRRRV
ncbi:hypothetical protein BV25DRAFT_1830369 [Artomyces pyxidatus]|uniref:Uncharacterized protein n=1 Tax=Artomyces pyxidatus TaxID=48021 RepID=A0ACB8SQK0_9AGAM|nr:hypothetical protein BV25DRAFT_1830369 [Artomyces pyxidatus]